MLQQLAQLLPPVVGSKWEDRERERGRRQIESTLREGDVDTSSDGPQTFPRRCAIDAYT